MCKVCVCVCKVSQLPIQCVIYIQISTDEDPAGHVTEDPSPSTVTDKTSGPPPQITEQISAVSHILLFILVVHVMYVSSKLCVAVTDLSTMFLLLQQDEEYARQLQCELDAMSDEPDRGGDVTVPLHQGAVTERVSDFGRLVL